MRRLLPIPLAILASLGPSAGAQQPDTVRLSELRRAAVAVRDPRGAQRELVGRIAALRQRSIGAELRPALAVEAQAQYQSDVTSVPIRLPNGQPAVSPPHQTYDGRLGIRQTLFDPSLGSRRAVEAALLAQNAAELDSRLYAVRAQVDELFFGALELQSREAELVSLERTLDAQLAVARARVRNGAALRGDSATLAAELLRRRQDLDDVVEERRATLEVLSDLTGRPIALDAVLALPADVADTSDQRVAARPELVAFARRRETLERQGSALRAELLPRLSAYARLGYGRPGLNMLSDSFDEYWLGGVQLTWTPWNWGITARRREELALQREILVTEQEALRQSIDRQAIRDRAAISRLERALATDARMIELRDIAAREARLRHGEGVITAAEYVARQNDAMEARLAGAAHRIQLSRARARYLETLGAGLRTPSSP